MNNELFLFPEGQPGLFVTAELTLPLDYHVNEKLMTSLAFGWYNVAKEICDHPKRIPEITLYPDRSENPFSSSDPWFERRNARREEWLKRPAWAPYTDPKPVLTLTYPNTTTNELLA